MIGVAVAAAAAEGGEEEESAWLLASASSVDDATARSVKRTGTIWTAVAHIITGVIGAGVLSLAWSVAQLGWIAGPLCIIAFAFVTLFSTSLLCDCYRFPHPQHGPTRLPSYMEAVRLYLGERSRLVCGIFTYENMYGTGIAYVITSASSIRAILKANCYHKEGHEATCSYGDSIYMLLFGLVQIVLSQIPDFQNMALLSVIAALMSFTYSSIGLGLGFAKVIENGRIMGSISGVPAKSASKLFSMFEALGDIAYAYPYAIIVFEIQDTLKSPPAENKTMKKASKISIFITTFFYLCCGCFSYAAFGDKTAGNLLTGFGFYEPYWLVDLANACVAVHLIGGYQIFSQPVFALVENWAAKKFPSSGLVNNFYSIKLPSVRPLRVNIFRVCFRTMYVASTTVIAMLFPYFNQVLGVLGSLNFWPLAIYFPVEMYFVQKNIGAWTTKWIALRAFSFICLIVSVLGLVGSLEGLISTKLS